MKEFKDIKKLLIVVDMINGFINEGSMKDESIRRIIGPIEKEINNYLKDEEGVAFIRDAHSREASEFRKFPVHCLKGTNEEKLIEEYQKYQDQALNYVKNSTSTVFADGFLADLNKMEQLEEVEIVGCCSDICVINAALPLGGFFDEHNRKVKIRVPQNLIDTFDSLSHNKNEYNMMAIKLLQLSGIDTKEI